MFRVALVLIALFALTPGLRADGPSRVIISVKEQKLMLMGNGSRLATYPISTSKFGVGDNWGRMTTPLGFLQVAEKIGDHAPVGAVFRNRRFTGEILQPNAPGRDPVITRIIWLKGLEASNAHAFSRCIYIHGTPEEKTIGRPASYGCIRMKSRDVTELYAQLPIGALVEIVNDKLPKIPKAPEGATFALEQRKLEPKAEPEPKAQAKPEPEKAAEAPAAPVEKPVPKPARTVKKNPKELQPHFGRSA
jgi:L,D-transpeptidase catalytic domain